MINGQNSPLNRSQKASKRWKRRYQVGSYAKTDIVNLDLMLKKYKGKPELCYSIFS
jgi:hypothetical protein